jgi:hypothetical protein
MQPRETQEKLMQSQNFSVTKFDYQAAANKIEETLIKFPQILPGCDMSLLKNTIIKYLETKQELKARYNTFIAEGNTIVQNSPVDELSAQSLEALVKNLEVLVAYFNAIKEYTLKTLGSLHAEPRQLFISFDNNEAEILTAKFVNTKSDFVWLYDKTKLDLRLPTVIKHQIHKWGGCNCAACYEKYHKDPYSRPGYY